MLEQPHGLKKHRQVQKTRLNHDEVSDNNITCVQNACYLILKSLERRINYEYFVVDAQQSADLSQRKILCSIFVSKNFRTLTFAVLLFEALLLVHKL